MDTNPPAGGARVAQLTAPQRALMGVDLGCLEARRLQHELGEIVKGWHVPPERHHELRAALNRLVVYVLHTRTHHPKDAPGATDRQRALEKVKGHATKLWKAMDALHPTTRDDLEHAGTPIAHLLAVLPHVIEATVALQQVAATRGQPRRSEPLSVALLIVKAYAAGTGRNPLVADGSAGLVKAIADTFVLLGMDAHAEHYASKAVDLLSPTSGR